MSMHNPKLYESYNDFQRRDATETLKNYRDKMEWKRNASIVDLGSGDGSVTKILVSQLHEDYKELIAVDISKDMVDYATENYGNEKTKFTLMDLTGEVPDEFKERFDHAFSSFVIQFLPEQKKVFSNIYDMLKLDGTFLVIMLGSCPYFEAYHQMAKDEKWRDCLKNVNNIMPKFFEAENWSVNFKHILERIGFKDCIIKDQPATYVHEKHRLKAMGRAGNFYNLDTKSKLFDEFYDEYIERIVNMSDRVDVLSDDGETFRVHYSLLIVYGKKKI